MKNYKIYFRLRGSKKYEVMEFKINALNCDDAKRKAINVLGYDFHMLKAKSIR